MPSSLQDFATHYATGLLRFLEHQRAHEQQQAASPAPEESQATPVNSGAVPGSNNTVAAPNTTPDFESPVATNDELSAEIRSTVDSERVDFMTFPLPSSEPDDADYAIDDHIPSSPHDDAPFDLEKSELEKTSGDEAEDAGRKNKRKWDELGKDEVEWLEKRKFKWAEKPADLREAVAKVHEALCGLKEVEEEAEEEEAEEEEENGAIEEDEEGKWEPERTVVTSSGTVA